MAYPTGMLAITLQRIDEKVAWLKVFCNGRIVALAANDQPASRITDLYEALRETRNQLAAMSGVSGLTQYARDQKANQALDVVQEFQTLMAQIDACTQWIATNLPKDANGYLLIRKLGDDYLVDRQFTPAQTSGLRSVLQNIVDAIA